jgi:hypothetical protein
LIIFGSAVEERVRYDNERGKGDHRHIRGEELTYQFQSVERLLDDFERDVRDRSAR